MHIQFQDMNKIQKLIKAISVLLHRPSLINRIIEDNEVWKMSFLKSYSYSRLSLPVVDLPHIIQTNKITIHCHSYLNGGSLVTDLALLKGLAKNINQCRYFEIGTWRGESVVNVSENALFCDTFNLSVQEMSELSINQTVIDQIGIFIKKQSNIRRLWGNTQTFDFSRLQIKYDLIFIDGDHRYAAVCNDTQKVFEHLIHNQSIVVWHDYAYSPDVVRYEVYKAILDSIPSALHQNLFHVRNTNCCIYHPNIDLPTKTLIYPDYPYYNFEVELSVIQQNY